MRPLVRVLVRSLIYSANVVRNSDIGRWNPSRGRGDPHFEGQMQAIEGVKDWHENNFQRSSFASVNDPLGHPPIAQDRRSRSASNDARGRGRQGQGYGGIGRVSQYRSDSETQRYNRRTEAGWNFNNYGMDASGKNNSASKGSTAVPGSENGGRWSSKESLQPVQQEYRGPGVAVRDRDAAGNIDIIKLTGQHKHPLSREAEKYREAVVHMAITSYQYMNMGEAFTRWAHAMKYNLLANHDVDESDKDAKQARMNKIKYRIKHRHNWDWDRICSCFIFYSENIKIISKCFYYWQRAVVQKKDSVNVWLLQNLRRRNLVQQKTIWGWRIFTERNAAAGQLTLARADAEAEAEKLKILLDNAKLDKDGGDEGEDGADVAGGGADGSPNTKGSSKFGEDEDEDDIFRERSGRYGKSPKSRRAVEQKAKKMMQKVNNEMLDPADAAALEYQLKSHIAGGNWLALQAMKQSSPKDVADAFFRSGQSQPSLKLIKGAFDSITRAMRDHMITSASYRALEEANATSLAANGDDSMLNKNSSTEGEQLKNKAGSSRKSGAVDYTGVGMQERGTDANVDLLKNINLSYAMAKNIASLNANFDLGQNNEAVL